MKYELLKDFESPFSIDMDLYPEFEQQDNRFSRSNYKSKYRGIAKCSSIQNYKTNIFEAKDGKYEPLGEEDIMKIYLTILTFKN